MKNLILLLGVFFLAACCKKETLNVNNHTLKVKSIVSYDSNDTIQNNVKYYFFYDSTPNAVLYKVMVGTINSPVKYEAIYIRKISNDTILFEDKIFYHNVYKIVVDGNQIQSIYQVDTISGAIESLTGITKDGNFISSITDKGITSILATNINYKNFVFSYNNCIKYDINWIEYLTGYPVNKSKKLQLYYSNKLLYNNIQTIGCLSTDISSVFNFITFVLRFDGYYALPPNKCLLDSIYSYKDTVLDIRYKYLYEYFNNTVSRIKIESIVDTLKFTEFTDITYY